MISKHPVYPHRIRKIPTQFSWVDHRLVRNGHINQCTHASLALYLFLVTVSDDRGLSYYSDTSLMKRLNMNEITLNNSRSQLMVLDLIAYKKPIYQVLPLDQSLQKSNINMLKRSDMPEPQVLGNIINQIMKESK